jgi:hypothetical protein
MTHEEDKMFSLGRAEAVLDVKMLILSLAKELMEDTDPELEPHRKDMISTLMALKGTIDRMIK